MKNEVSHVLEESERRALVEHLENNVQGRLVQDVSNYAKGRTRAWLQWEGPLSKWRDYGEGVRDDKLWPWLVRLWQAHGWPGTPDLGLAIHGPVGIRPHRDATYAHANAVTVNLGAVEWGWHPQRQGNDPEGLDWRTLSGGEILRFDCKHLHSSRRLDAKRWAIILWQAKIPTPDQRAKTLFD